MAESTPDALTVDEIEAIGKPKLPKYVLEYYESGADDQKVLVQNRAAFDRLLVRPRAMVDVTYIDTSIDVFGVKYPFPIAFAPSAMQRLAHPDGEMAVANAAKRLGINMTLSSQSTTSLEDVATVKNDTADGPEKWFQLYMTQEPSSCEELVKRAEAAGYKAVVLTVDTPILGNRINERKNAFTLPDGLTLGNYANARKVTSKEGPQQISERLMLNARTAAEAHAVVKKAGPTLHSSSLTWQKTLPWLRSVTSMKIILKGLMTEEDAELAVESGVDAIVVSNHGGRQLDCCPATLEALPAVAAAVRGRIPVFMDGGIRHGSDVFKAVALGADMVLIGRPVLWGLAYNGQAGVEAVANILERELARTMALAGVTTIKGIRQSALAVRKVNGFGLSRL